ncbi:MAG: hypothetical protein PHF37_00895 [Phycisphaerae bacterium]|nr:hypothetical protein [Phycisphaerae bacterium]
MSRLCFIFVVFFFTIAAIFTVYIRNCDNIVVYDIFSDNIEQNRLRQKLWQKQLKFESDTTPAAIGKYLPQQEQKKQ